MASSFWLLWVVFLVFFVASPLGYGWVHRNWGPPLPRYVQRRRARLAAATRGRTFDNHEAWGWGGDFVWLMFIVAVFWVAAGMVWG